MSIEACTKPMVDSTNSIAYSAYTTFYTHAEAMCFYLQSEAFQRATEVAVDALHASARGTAAHLGELQSQAGLLIDDTKAIRLEQAAASEAAHALLEGQKAASRELGSLASQQAEAFDKAGASIKQLGGESQAALLELKRGTEEIGTKQGLLLGGLDKVLSLQGTVLGEFLDAKAVLFYTCAVLLALCLTATQRTGSARLPCFAILTANLLLEKLLATWFLPLLMGGGAAQAAEAAAAASGGGGVTSEAMRAWLALTRRLATAAIVAALGYSALHHTDVGKKTLSDLAELKRMHQESSDEMQSRLERLEAEAAKLRARESTRVAVAAVAMRKQQRRASSPLYNHLYVGGSGGGGSRRALSPLHPASTGRKPRSPSSKEQPPPQQQLDLAGSATSAEYHYDNTNHNTAATAAPGGGGGGSTHQQQQAVVDLDHGKPPAPSAHDDVYRVAATNAALAALNGDGATPTASRGMGGRGRRSSVGSTDTESNTPTRRSARIASRQQPVTAATPY